MNYFQVFTHQVSLLALVLSLFCSNISLEYLCDMGVILDLVVFEWLLAEQIPELCKHFRNIQLSLFDLVAPWFFNLFITHVPSETAFWV